MSAILVVPERPPMILSTCILRQLLALDRFREKSGGLLARALERVRARVVDDRLESRARRDDRDARAHGAAAGDAYGLDVSHLYACRSLFRCNEAAPDQLPVDLVRAFPDLGDLRVAHQALDTIILAVAVAAVKLHRIGRDAHREIRCAHLEHRRLDAEIGGARVDHARDVPQPRFAHCEIGRHVGEHELDALELDDACGPDWRRSLI